MDVSYARNMAALPAGTQFNTPPTQRIKDIKACETGLVEIITEAGNTVPFNAVTGEWLSIQGMIQITNNTAITLCIHGVSIINEIWADDGSGALLDPWDDSEIWSEF